MAKAKRYRLLKDLPGLVAGDILEEINREYFIKDIEGRLGGPGYIQEDLDSNPDWFEPIPDEPEDKYPWLKGLVKAENYLGEPRDLIGESVLRDWQLNEQQLTDYEIARRVVQAYADNIIAAGRSNEIYSIIKTYTYEVKSNIGCTSGVTFHSEREALGAINDPRLRLFLDVLYGVKDKLELGE